MDFEEAFEWIKKIEGGYVNDPRDPGGETKWGISKRAYPNLDIKNLTEVEAKRLYERDYWWKSGANKLPFPVNLMVFDTAVNMGVKRAKEFLTKTTKLMNRSPEEISDLLHRLVFYFVYRHQRESLYLSLGRKPRYRRFLVGWLRRLNKLDEFVLYRLTLTDDWLQ